MSLLNRFLGALFGALLFPFASLHPLVGLAVVSLLTAVLMLLLFRATSDQERIAQVKRRLVACIYEVRLFNDDLRAILRAQLELLRHNLTYLRLSLAPMLWTLPLFVLIAAQLEVHYGYHGLAVGDRTVFTVELDPGWSRQVSPEAASGRPAVSLSLPAGLRLETPGVWIRSKNEISWRILAEREGDLEIEVRAGNATYGKRVSVKGGIARLSPVRVASGLWRQLLHPVEPALPETSPIHSIAVAYAPREIAVLGHEFHWMWVFVVLSLVFAFALKDWFGVTI